MVNDEIDPEHFAETPMSERMVRDLERIARDLEHVLAGVTIASLLLLVIAAEIGVRLALGR